MTLLTIWCLWLSLRHVSGLLLSYNQLTCMHSNHRIHTTDGTPSSIGIHNSCSIMSQYNTPEKKNLKRYKSLPHKSNFFMLLRGELKIRSQQGKVRMVSQARFETKMKLSGRPEVSYAKAWASAVLKENLNRIRKEIKGQMMVLPLRAVGLRLKGGRAFS